MITASEGKQARTLCTVAPIFFQRKLNPTKIYINNCLHIICSCSKYCIYCSNNNMKNIFFLGSVPRPSLAHYYRSCVCTFLPSFEESYGVSIYEAGYFQKVVLVFNPSLLVAPFVKHVDLNSTFFSDLDIYRLSVFPNDVGNFLITPAETLPISPFR